MSYGIEQIDELLSRAAKQDFSQTDPIDSLGVDDAGTDVDLTQSLETHKAEALRQELDEARSTHDLRKKYLPKIFCLIVSWLVFIGVVLAIYGWRLKTKFFLPDGVLIALITSTTIGVLGLFAIAAKWLFPQKSGS